MKKAQLATLVALAFPLAAVAQSTPAPGSGSLDVWFKSPRAGNTVSGTLSGTNCYVAGTGVSRVEFLVDSTRVSTDTTMSDGMQCQIDTTRFANGSHTFTAVAYSSTGASRKDVMTVNISNTVTQPTQPANTAPTVSMTSPAAGNVSGTITYAANATDSAGVSRVDFALDGTQILSDTSAPYGGTLDTTKLANGTHVITATAYDAAGLSAASQVSINVQNTVTQPTQPTSTTTEAPRTGSTDVWFKNPTSGKTVSGVLTGSNCYVAASGSIARVAFTIDGNAVNTDSTPADGMQCVLDTTKLSNGTHSLKATATDSSGASRSDLISINVQNSGTTSPTSPTNAAPSVSITAPSAGATISGTAAACSATASDDKGVASVAFALNGTAIVTDTASPYTCTIDTTKFANGTYNLTAVATDTDGVKTTATRTVTVSNTVAQTPSTVTPPSNLLFWSGFEGPLSIGTPTDCYNNGCFQSLTGKDSKTGFTWPISIAGGSNQWQLLVNGPTPTPSTVGNWMYNQLQTVPGPKGTSTQAMYSEIRQSGCCGTNPQGGASTQDTFHVYPGREPGDLYFSKWIKLQPDLVSNLAGGDPWRVLFEWKTGGSPAYPQGGDFRVILNIVAWGGSTPFWQVTWDNDANGGLPYQQFYRGENRSVPVPIGQWFKFEAFWHRSSGNDGRAWFAINGQVISDHYGPTIGVNNAPVGRIMINQVYTGAPYPIYQWIDDVQIWQGFPTVSSTDPWYDPPYAPH